MRIFHKFHNPPTTRDHACFDTDTYNGASEGKADGMTVASAAMRSPHPTRIMLLRIL